MSTKRATNTNYFTLLTLRITIKRVAMHCYINLILLFWNICADCVLYGTFGFCLIFNFHIKTIICDKSTKKSLSVWIRKLIYNVTWQWPEDQCQCHEQINIHALSCACRNFSTFEIDLIKVNRGDWLVVHLQWIHFILILESVDLWWQLCIILQSKLTVK